MATTKVSESFVQTYNELLHEVEKLTLRSVDERHDTAKKFKERTGKLRCPAKANVSTLHDKMVQAVDFFKTVQFEGKSTIVLGLPLVKKT